MLKISLNYSIIGIVLLTALLSSLAAQPVLRKIVGAEGRPGEPIEIMLRGENLDQVVRVEAVRFDDERINILDYRIESDEVIRIQIRIPFSAKPGRYKIAVLVADAQTQKWLEPTTETITLRHENVAIGDTTSSPAIRQIEIRYDRNLVDKEEGANILLLQNEEGVFVSRTFMIKNTGEETISLSNLKLPPHLTMNGELPNSLAPQESATFELQLNPNAPDAFIGKMQLSLDQNDESPFILPIQVEREPPSAVVSDTTDHSPKLVVAFDRTAGDDWSEFGKALIIKNISADTLTIDGLTLPRGFISSADFPVTVAGTDSRIVQIRLDPELLTTFEGDLLFASHNLDERFTDFQITATAIPNPFSKIEIMDGGQPISSGQTSPIDFGETAVGYPISKSFSIINSSEGTIHLDNLGLPGGLVLVGTFPTQLNSGEQAVFTVALNADSAQNISGEIQFNTNIAGQNVVRFPVRGTVQADVAGDTPPKPFPWLPVIIAAAVLSAGLGGGYLLLRGAGKKYLPKSSVSGSVSGKTTFSFKPKIDNGVQTIKQSTPIKGDFEMRLKPGLDYGKQDLLIIGPLILSHEFASEDKQSGGQDDLTRIEGIGPKISAILQGAGIRTFSELERSKVETLQQILTDAGIIGIADPATWPRQAKLAAAGKWQQLDELQEQLKGGRIVDLKV